MKIIDDHELAAVLDQHIGDDGPAYDEMIRTGKVRGSEMLLDLQVEAMEQCKPETVVITRDGRRVRRMRGHWVAD